MAPGTEATPERAAVELRLRMRQVVALVTQQGLGRRASTSPTNWLGRRAPRSTTQHCFDRCCTGSGSFALARGRFAEAAELTDELRQLADRQPDPVLELQAHNAASYDHIVAGRPAVAMAHIERCLELYDPTVHARLALLYGADPAVECHQWAAVATWLLGYPDRARNHAGEACRLAHELGYPNDMFEASWCAVVVHVLCRDAEQIRKHIDALFGVCDQYGLARVTAHAAIIDGWLVAQQGASVSAIAQIREGLAEISAAKDPFFSSLLAETLAGLGDTAAALEAASEALDSARLTGDLEYESELVRVRGELLLRTDPSAADDSVSDAESTFVEALAIARQQQAKSFELRAAISLARLWQSRGQQAQARSLLVETYGWFTEGHDTHDLETAAAMLAELG